MFSWQYFLAYFPFFFNSKELKKLESRFWHRRDVHPSVHTPIPKSFLSVRFSKFFFCWKVMISETYLLYFSSVRPYLRTDRQTKSSVCVKCRSFSPILKILFCRKGMTPDTLFFIHCVRLSLQFSARLSVRFSFHISLEGLFWLPTVLTVRFSKFFFCLKGMTPDTYIYTLCPFVSMLHCRYVFWRCVSTSDDFKN